MTDPLGQSQVINYLIGLSKKGYKFDILSFEKPDKYASLKDEIKTLLDHNNIGWYPQIFHTTPPIFSKIYDRAKLLSVAKGLHKKNKYNLIHCRSYTAAEVGLQLKRKTGVKFLFDMRGFWADEKRDGGAWNSKYYFWRLVYKYYKKKEIDFITNSDHIVSLTEVGKTEIVKWKFYDKKIPISVIPCCANSEYFSLINSTKKRFAKELNNIDSKTFVISYLGSLGSWYMIDEMLLFFKMLLKEIPNSLFFIITNSNHNIILQKIEKYQLNESNLKIITVPFNEVATNMYASDCSISFIKPVYSKMSSSPVKIGEILSMGIPIIANSIGDIGKVLKENKLGALIEDFSVPSYNNVIKGINNIVNIDPQKIRNSAIEIYSLEKGIKKYFMVYQSLLH